MNIVGKLDKKSGSQSIFGYALDIDNLSDEVEIKLTIDNEEYYTKCNRNKVHLKEKYNSSNHGFKLEIPQRFKDGNLHLVTLSSADNKIIDQAKIVIKKGKKNEHDLAVIIPFYNSSDTVDSCLNSIINNKCGIDIEIICIDDGSTDNTLDILNKYKSKDSRIKIISQKNLYAGVARNNGMLNCNSKYITFVDSDDKLSSIENLEKAFLYAQNNSIDVLCCGASEININGEFIRNLDYVLRKDFIGNQKIFKLDDLKDVAFMTFSGVPWGKLYKKSLIDKHNIEFLNLKRSEDFYFVQIALMRAEKISYKDYPLIQHRVGSTTNLESNKDETPLIFWQADIKFHEYVMSHPELHKFILPMQISTMNRFFYNAVSVKKLESFKQIVDTIINYSKSELPACDFSKISDASKYVIKKFNSLVSEKTLLDIFFERFCNLDYSAKVDFLTKNLNINIEQNSKFLSLTTKNEKSSPKVCTDDGYKIIKQGNRDNKPFLSVIIPVYNVQDYLEKCLDSIINQKGIELEIICVDDGSTDNSLDILKDYAQKYDFITVISQKNLMAGIARNNGLQFASGKYVHFVDSDDWLNENIYKKIFSVPGSKDANLILCSYLTYNQTTHEMKSDYFFSKMSAGMFNRVMSFEKNSKLLLNSPVVPWNKIIKRDLLVKEKLAFDSLKCVNDRSFNFKLLPIAQRIIIINEPIITYRIGNNKSLIGVRHQNFDCHFKSFDEIKQLYSDKNYKSDIINVFIFDLIHWLDVFSKNPNYDLRPINSAIKSYLENNREFFSLSNIDMKDKVRSFIKSYLS